MEAQLATTQKQGLSLLLRRSLELFQWPFDELQRFVHEQVESNPFLTLPEHSGNFDIPERQHVSVLSIRDFLCQQIIGWDNKEIAEHLIGLLDDDGYFREPLQALTKTLKRTYEELEQFIQKLQALEPAGVFARNLPECYALQLKDLGEWTNEWEVFLPKLHCPLSELTAEFSLARVRVLMKRLRHLAPYPAKDYEDSNQLIVIPDLIASYENQTWTCELNPYITPQVGIQSEYLSFIPKVKEEEQRKLKEQFKSAKWLSETLSRRAYMLRTVALYILEYQTEFFIRGAQGLKPLTLKQIANQMDVHESTISRIIRHKYAQTDRGTFSLKFFFNQGVNSHIFSWETDKISAHNIQDHVRQLIEKEPHFAPYSDQKLVDLLKAKGIPIARRTITKYRMINQIPSASQRKELYEIQ